MQYGIMIPGERRLLERLLRIRHNSSAVEKRTPRTQDYPAFALVMPRPAGKTNAKRMQNQDVKRGMMQDGFKRRMRQILMTDPDGSSRIHI
ncbi:MULTISPECIES: hypothetical protein [Methanocalculus]|uniref:hypothetical protein n=1 Tax=Methanocalculus TaxID=71151 RepID=UPI00209EA26F|nr:MULTISPECIES: hypothetical protein [unclassified Methanocalculus]